MYYLGTRTLLSIGSYIACDKGASVEARKSNCNRVLGYSSREI